MRQRLKVDQWNYLFAICYLKKKELEDKRTRARFREQVLLSLSFDGNTSFDQVLSDGF